MRSNLAYLLFQADIISKDMLMQLNRIQEQEQISINEQLANFGIMSEDELLNKLEQLLSLPKIDLDNDKPLEVCIELEVEELALRHQALPTASDDTDITLAVYDPTRPQIVSDFQFHTGRKVSLVLADRQALLTLLARLSDQQATSNYIQASSLLAGELENLTEQLQSDDNAKSDPSSSSSPISRFIHSVIIDATTKKASDIHFEPAENQYRIRIRCDGLLYDAYEIDYQLHRQLSSRIKVLASLDIAERRRPQDGRIKLKNSKDQTIDIRVSTLPTTWGEKIVLRLFYGYSEKLEINQLGLSSSQEMTFRQVLRQPQGMILVTGPTGCGKTVSLYAGLSSINQSHKNILTAEDPVEMDIDGINQVQINTEIGFSFAQALRTFLRQDPDVIMLGEIRDKETADIAIRAANTGHLVLSTLHTNSALETLPRLRSMGIDSFNLTSALSLVISQRLIRRLCPLCKFVDTSIDQMLSSVIYQADTKGCHRCNQGYIGRVGIYELLSVTPKIIEALNQDLSLKQLEAIAQEQGFHSIRYSARCALELGITSRSEIERVMEPQYCISHKECIDDK